MLRDASSWLASAAWLSGYIWRSHTPRKGASCQGPLFKPAEDAETWRRRQMAGEADGCQAERLACRLLRLAGPLGKPTSDGGPSPRKMVQNQFYVKAQNSC